MLDTTWKRILLSIHILLAAIWIGGLTAMLLLLHNSANPPNGDEVATINRAIFHIHEYAIVNVSLLFTYTGLCFSLFTDWGGFRFYWILLKWVVFLLLSLALTLSIAPAVNSMAAISDTLRIEALSNPQYLQARSQTLLFVWIELLLLVALVILSVFKPWGVRRRQFHLHRWLSLGAGTLLALGVGFQLFMSNVGLAAYRQLPVENVNLAAIADVTYRGEETVGGFAYIVEVTVSDRRIQQVKILQNRSAIYPKLAEGISRKVIRMQRIDLDGITGATTTSKALLFAMQNALQKGAKK